MLSMIGKLLGLGPKVNLGELVANGALVLDVRTREEYRSGHVKGSVNIPLDELGAGLKKLGNKDQVIITCCASGMRSGAAKGFLKSRGYTNVHNGGSWRNLN